MKKLMKNQWERKEIGIFLIKCQDILGNWWKIIQLEIYPETGPDINPQTSSVMFSTILNIHNS